MSAYRDHYYPNTEPLAKNEMRVTALGTGRPFLRPAQANASWLIELGNGDKFMFDYGFGSQVNISGLEIPYADMTAYFATHLHTDHVWPNKAKHEGWGERMQMSRWLADKQIFPKF